MFKLESRRSLFGLGCHRPCAQAGGDVVIDVDEDRQFFRRRIRNCLKRAFVDEGDQPEQIHFQRVGEGVFGVFQLSLKNAPHALVVFQCRIELGIVAVLRPIILSLFQLEGRLGQYLRLDIPPAHRGLVYGVIRFQRCLIHVG